MRKLLALAFFCAGATSAQIVSMTAAAPQFNGTGLNDMLPTTGSTYVGVRANHTYQVKVCATGTVDT